MMKALFGLVLVLPSLACDDTVYSVQGSVQLQGAVPGAKLNKALGNDPACCALHPELPPLDNLVVDKDGGVRWAFVWVKSGLPAKEWQPPKEPVTIDQKGCIYAPHMVGVQVGQEVVIRNKDPLLHNVHGLPFVNKEFNFGQSQNASNTVKFALPEVPIKVKCDVHPWMATFIGVVDHPYFAVTDEKGRFEIKNLPAGTYTFGVWHEGLAAPDQKVGVVSPNARVDFVMNKK